MLRRENPVSRPVLFPGPRTSEFAQTALTANLAPIQRSRGSRHFSQADGSVPDFLDPLLQLWDGVAFPVPGSDGFLLVPEEVVLNVERTACRPQAILRTMPEAMNRFLFAPTLVKLRDPGSTHGSIEVSTHVFRRAAE
jgi:hypothetical protein